MDKKYKLILMDVDGCLASFCDAVIKQLNSVTGYNVTIDDIIEQCNWDLEKLWDMDQKTWWNAIDQNPYFWLEIEPFEWAREMYWRLHDYADEVGVSTAPPMNEWAVAHKCSWIKNHIGVKQSDIMVGKKKYWMAGPDTLLIDDAPHNVEAFQKRGGKTILVPSDWNTKDLNFDMVWRVIEDGLKS